MNLPLFQQNNLFEATETLFNDLGFTFIRTSKQSLSLQNMLKEQYKQNTPVFQAVTEAYYIGSLDADLTAGKSQNNAEQDAQDKEMLLFAVHIHQFVPTKTDLIALTKAFNKRSQDKPVIVVCQYIRDNNSCIAIATAHRNTRQKQSAKYVGEVVGKVSILKDINTQQTHRAHYDILQELKVPAMVTTFAELYVYWLKVLDTKKLNKKFFREIANWYFWAVDESSFPTLPAQTQKQANETALIRLLTRLIFVWFIKEKGLVNENLFDENFLQDTLHDFGNGENYYKAILQNLFFATLNRDVSDRGFAEDKGFAQNRTNFDVNSFYRYENLFKNQDTAHIMSLFAQTPFLNGGLFDSLDNKDAKEYIDGFTRIAKHQAQMPDCLFFGEVQDYSKELREIYQTKKDTYKVQGIINILKKYKFTVEENTPLEEDIALDPELLGQVFENLLAYYNEETKTTARKGTGSFYTPREIVDYMVEESLLAYLRNALPALESLHDLPTHPEKEKAIKALAEMKILDPACGSGAFPMGVLHKVVSVLKEADKDNQLWRKIQTENAEREIKLAYDNITEKQARQDRLKEIDDVFENNLEDYGRKLFIIQNCIYGIDIQNIAIQISKLRFFLSLIIEQNNENIKPLPNLETKFVCANTLIGLNKPVLKTGDVFQQDTFNEIDKIAREIKDIRNRYFTVRNRTQKLAYQTQDQEKRTQISKLLSKIGYTLTNAKKIANFNLFDQKAKADWFDAEWMFGIKNGFDVVIGNPLYVQIQTMKDKQKEWEAQRYETYTKMGDIYALFYERGNQLLKPQGLLAYITSNKWMRAGYGESLRQYFVEKTQPLQLIDMGAGVFESATVDTNILLFRKLPESFKLSGSYLRAVTYAKNELDLPTFFKNNAVTLQNLTSESWNIANDSTQQIKAKIEKVGKPLKEWDINIYRGILTGFNDAFVIDEATKNDLIRQESKSAEIIKPLLNGDAIKAYTIKFEGVYLINAHNGDKKNGIKPIDIEKNYKAIHQYILGQVAKVEQGTIIDIIF